MTTEGDLADYVQIRQQRREYVTMQLLEEYLFMLATTEKKNASTASIILQFLKFKQDIQKEEEDKQFKLSDQDLKKIQKIRFQDKKHKRHEPTK